jgi:hypothetical protein
MEYMVYKRHIWIPGPPATLDVEWDARCENLASTHTGLSQLWMSNGTQDVKTWPQLTLGRVDRATEYYLGRDEWWQPLTVRLGAYLVGDLFAFMKDEAVRRLLWLIARD